ncbi:MAG: hypothetical protein M1587_02175, partial [Thaumarchaeota archaeon]|nr:hypothetical protein [Nitrososphaerota archaeon]
EIVMDNDLVLWKMPPTLIEGIESESLIALTDGAGQYYGDYQQTFNEVGSNLRLNAGLLGMPPRYKGNLQGLEGKVMRDFFHSEQGFSALNFLEYKGSKRLIPVNEVTQLNVFDVSPEELISEYCGGHFCGCSYGHYDYWNRKYAFHVRKEISKLLQRIAID